MSHINNSAIRKFVSITTLAMGIVTPAIYQTVSANTPRCSPVEVAQLQPYAASFDGKRYTFRVAGYADTRTSTPYLGTHQNRKPAKTKVSIQYGGRTWVDLGELTLTKYMTQGRGYRVRLNNQTTTPFLKSSIITLTATTMVPECGPAAMTSVSQKFDLRTVKYGQKPKKIGRPHYYSQGFNVPLSRSRVIRNQLAGARP